METKQIIIFLIIIAVYLFKVIRKANAKNIESQQNTNKEMSVDQEEYEYTNKETKTYRDMSTESYEEIDYSQMLTKRQIIAESLETSSLEGESYEKNVPPKKDVFSSKKTMQYVDNEVDEGIEIGTDLDDIKRGFLYSEILKRKYN